MAQNHQGVCSAEIEATSSKFIVAKIKENSNNLSWAQVAAMPASNNRKSAKNAKKEATQPKPAKSIELRVTDLRVEQNKSYQSPAVLDNLDSVQSQTHPGDANANNQQETPRDPDISTNRNPNNRDEHKGGGGRANGGSTQCNHCKKVSHTRDNCWFLHPELRPVKENRGTVEKGSDQIKGETSSRVVGRKGYGSKTLEIKEEREGKRAHESGSSVVTQTLKGFQSHSFITVEWFRSSLRPDRHDLRPNG